MRYLTIINSLFQIDLGLLLEKIHQKDFGFELKNVSNLANEIKATLSFPQKYRDEVIPILQKRLGKKGITEILDELSKEHLIEVTNEGLVTIDLLAPSLLLSRKAKSELQTHYDSTVVSEIAKVVNDSDNPVAPIPSGFDIRLSIIGNDINVTSFAEDMTRRFRNVLQIDIKAWSANMLGEYENIRKSKFVGLLRTGSSKFSELYERAGAQRRFLRSTSVAISRIASKRQGWNEAKEASNAVEQLCEEVQRSVDFLLNAYSANSAQLAIWVAVGILGFSLIPTLIEGRALISSVIDAMLVVLSLSFTAYMWGSAGIKSRMLRSISNLFVGFGLTI